MSDGHCNGLATQNHAQMQAIAYMTKAALCRLLPVVRLPTAAEHWGMPQKLSENHIQTAFGQALRDERTSQGISQEELGFRSEVHRTYISELERGIKSPSLGTITRLSNALDVLPSKLLGLAEGLMGKKRR